MTSRCKLIYEALDDLRLWLYQQKYGEEKQGLIKMLCKQPGCIHLDHMLLIVTEQEEVKKLEHIASG